MDPGLKEDVMWLGELEVKMTSAAAFWTDRSHTEGSGRAARKEEVAIVTPT